MQEYNFRVKAGNMCGHGDPLNGAPVVAKDPFDKPSAPGTPKVTDVDKDRVSLKWDPPKDDGGSPIEGW